METVEVVIRLKKERYDELQKNKHLPNRLGIEKAITDGTVLPKGHGRLKDVDHYVKMQWEHPDYSLTDDEPTIIEADKGN